MTKLPTKTLANLLPLIRRDGDNQILPVFVLVGEEGRWVVSLTLSEQAYSVKCWPLTCGAHAELELGAPKLIPLSRAVIEMDFVAVAASAANA